MSPGIAERHDKLLRLMREAYETCVQLRDYSEENSKVFAGDDEDLMLEVIERREEFIDSLIATEYEIDLILDEVDDYASGDALPEDVEKLRMSVRSILQEISMKDMDLMKILGEKIQKCKTSTLRARNRKNLAAYKRAMLASEQSGMGFLK